MSNNLKIKRLSHVSLSTKDFKKVEKFYCDILGMQIVHKFVNPQNEIYGLFLHAGNSTFLEFFKSSNLPEKTGRLRHFCFEILNIYEIKKIFEKNDFDVSISRGKTDRILQFTVKDFEENLVEFHQHDDQSKLKFYINEKA